MSSKAEHEKREIADPRTEQMTEGATASSAEVVDEGTEVMDPEPDPAAEMGRAGGLADDPVIDLVEAETRRMRAGEVVDAALPFQPESATPEAVPNDAPVAGDPAASAVEVPEALTEAVRPKDIHKEPLPFKSGHPRATPSADLDEVNEIAWRSRVGIDPNDLPSAQLVVPSSDDEAAATPAEPLARRNLLAIVLLLVALVVGFAAVALLAR